MAVTMNSSSSIALGNVSSGNSTHPMAAGSHRTLLTQLTYRSSIAPVVNSITFTPNGGSATNMRLYGAFIVNGLVFTAIYGLNDADVDLGVGNGTIAVAYSATPNGLQTNILAIAYNDTDQATTLDSLIDNNSGGVATTSVSTVVTSVADGCVPVDFFYTRNSATSITEGAGQTVHATVTISTTNFTRISDEAAIPTGGGTATMSWSWTTAAQNVQYAGTIAPYPRATMPNHGQLYPLPHDMALQFVTPRSSGQLFPL